MTRAGKTQFSSPYIKGFCFPHIRAGHKSWQTVWLSLLELAGSSQSPSESIRKGGECKVHPFSSVACAWSRVFACLILGTPHTMCLSIAPTIQPFLKLVIMLKSYSTILLIFPSGHTSNSLSKHAMSNLCPLVLKSNTVQKHVELKEYWFSLISPHFLSHCLSLLTLCISSGKICFWILYYSGLANSRAWIKAVNHTILVLVYGRQLAKLQRLPGPLFQLHMPQHNLRMLLRMHQLVLLILGCSGCFI